MGLVRIKRISSIFRFAMFDYKQTFAPNISMVWVGFFDFYGFLGLGQLQPKTVGFFWMQMSDYKETLLTP
jgi:hypothetical protein